MISPKRRIAVMGLSGVGKTTLARRLPKDSWFHYSVDYRIWTHYLGDDLSDYLKALASSHPVLRQLLKADAIAVEPRVQFDNLLATSIFMGMLGKPSEHGLSETEFRKRMAKHAVAEKSAMLDTPQFIDRAWQLYKYPNFFADLSGSLCEIVDPSDPNDPVLACIRDSCQLVYIRASDQHIKELVQRNQECPKPIYYRPEFLDAELPGLLKAFSVDKLSQVSPSDVGSYLYPRLMRERIKRYEAIAKRFTVVLTMEEVYDLQSEELILKRIFS